MGKYFEQYTEKTNPVGDDIGIIADSEETNAQGRLVSKKIQLKNIKTSVLNNDAEFIKKTEGVGELADVEVTSPQNQDALIFNSATGKFENINLPGGGDMLKSVYDPQGIGDDAFDRENHTGVAPVKSIGEGGQFQLANILSTSLISGGEITVNAGDNTKFDIAAGKGVVIDNHTNPENPTVTTVSFGPFTAVSPTYLTSGTVSYISVDVNGNLVQDFELPVREKLRDAFLLGALVHLDLTTITQVNNFAVAPYTNLALNLDDWIEAVGGLMNPDGNVYTYNGANMKLNKSAGRVFWIGANYKNNIKDPNNISTSSLTALTFIDTWTDGAGGFNLGTAKTDIIAGIYDDGTGGATQPNGTVPVNNFVNHKIYFDASSNLTIIQYGQNTYATLDTAVSNLTTESFEKNPVLKGLIFRGWVTVKSNATDLSDPTQARFTAGGVFNEIGSANLTTVAANLQSAYQNSGEPEITTNETLGALSVKEGTGDNTKKVYEGKNAAGVVTYSVDGNGDVEANKFKGDGSGLTNLPSGGGITLLSTTTLTSATAQVDLTIPSGYKEYKVEYDMPVLSAGANLNIRVNNNSTGPYLGLLTYPTSKVANLSGTYFSAETYDYDNPKIGTLDINTKNSKIILHNVVVSGAGFVGDCFTPETSINTLNIYLSGGVNTPSGSIFKVYGIN